MKILELRRLRKNYRLNFLGWTQEEIGKATGPERSSISKIVKNGNISKIHNSLQEWLSKGKSVEEAHLSP